MNNENFIKGKVAALITGLMFEEAGYLVMNYGSDGIAQLLAQLGIKKGDGLTELLLSTPAFIVINEKTHIPALVQVKYRGSVSRVKNVSWGKGKLDQYWPGSYLIIVQSEQPYFSVAGETKKGFSATPLVDAQLNISPELIEKFSLLIKKFLK